MRNVRQVIGFITPFAVIACSVWTGAYGQDSETIPRLIRFVNLMDSQVEIHFVGEKGETELHTKLDPNTTIDQETFVGRRWVMMSDQAKIAEFFVDETAQQFQDPQSKLMIDQVVDIKALASWQGKVELVFDNQTPDELDILWVDPDGVERVYAIELPPGKAHVQRDANPAETWTIRRHGELMAEYSATNAPKQFINIKELIVKTKNRVAVAFQNTTDKNVDVLWIEPNVKPVFYAVDLPPGRQHIQLANPGDLWQVQSDGIVIGNYVVLKQKAPQFVDIAKLPTNSK